MLVGGGQRIFALGNECVMRQNRNRRTRPNGGRSFANLRASLTCSAAVEALLFCSGRPTNARDGISLIDFNRQRLAQPFETNFSTAPHTRG